MVWTIPYTFQAGTKARANEVNENFTSLKQFVDQLEVNQASSELDITNLENNKASINGSNTEIFSAADPTTNYNVVNLQTFERLTQNSVRVIAGYQLSIFDNDTITAKSGSCYDSTYSNIITSPTSLQVSDSNLGANATRYVYVCLDNDTGQTELVLSTSETTPTLPSGYEYFRRIGYLITDGDGNISSVVDEGTAETDNEKATNGYVELGGGLYLQWGQTGKVGRLTASTISFPKIFPNACVSVVANPTGWDGSHGDKVGMPWRTGYYTTSSFQIYNNNEEYSVSYSWIAIGY